MATLRGTLLACATLAFGAASAQAADLGGRHAGYGMKDYAPMIHAKRSWYIRGDASYAFHDDPFLIEDSTTNLTQSSYDGTWSFGGGIGKNFTSNIRGDVTVEYRTETDIEGRSSQNMAGVRSFGIESTLVMANLYYDFGNRDTFSPYLGVGLGAIRHDVSGGTVPGGTIAGHDNWDTAAALMAGMTFNVSRVARRGARATGGKHLHLDVGYRFLYMGETETGRLTDGFNSAREVVVEDMHAHEIRLGLRYEFR